MAKCSNCGYEVTDGSTFCQQCGARVEPQVTPIAPTPGFNNGPQVNPVVPPTAPENPQPAPNNYYGSQPTPQPAPNNYYGSQPTPVVPNAGGNPGGPSIPKIKKPNIDFKKIFANKKLCGIIGGVVAAIVLIIILVNVFGSSGPESLMKSAIKGYNKRSTSYSVIEKEEMNSYKSDVYKQSKEIAIKCEVDDYDSLNEYAEDYLEGRYESCDDRYGDDWKISIEIKKTKDYSSKDDEFEMIEERWEDYVEDLEDSAEYYEKRADSTNDDDYEEYYTQLSEMYEKYANKYEKYKVTAVREIKVKITVKGDDDKYSDTETLYFAKINGKWVLMRGSIF